MGIGTKERSAISLRSKIFIIVGVYISLCIVLIEVQGFTLATVAELVVLLGYSIGYIRMATQLVKDREGQAREMNKQKQIFSIGIENSRD